MSAEERRQFLLHGTRTAKVATVRRDGRPHVTPLWFTLDGDDLLFATAADSLKARTLRRDPRVSVCVDRQEEPYAFVVIDGTATLVDTPATVAEWYRRIAARYDAVPEPEGDGEADRYNRPVGVLVRVTPVHVVAVSYDD